MSWYSKRLLICSNIKKSVRQLQTNLKDHRHICQWIRFVGQLLCTNIAGLKATLTSATFSRTILSRTTSMPVFSSATALPMGVTDHASAGCLWLSDNQLDLLVTACLLRLHHLVTWKLSKADSLFLSTVCGLLDWKSLMRFWVGGSGW